MINPRDIIALIIVVTLITVPILTLLYIKIEPIEPVEPKVQECVIPENRDCIKKDFGLEDPLYICWEEK